MITVPQCDAMIEIIQVGVELAAGDLPAAGSALHRALDASVAAADGPIAAQVADAAARVAVAGADPRAAAVALGIAVRRRGTVDRGDAEVLAAHAAVAAALGAGAAAAIEAGRALDLPAGSAAVRAIAARFAPE